MAAFRVCERTGWTLAQFYALDWHEQREWLARDAYRQNYLQRVRAKFLERDAEGRTKFTPEAAAILLTQEF